MMDRKKTFKNSLVLSMGLLVLIALGSPHILFAACAGDINMDGKVDIFDREIMNVEMGRNDCFTVPCQSDLNSDGTVNSQDNELLQAELGRNDCFAESMDFRERDRGTHGNMPVEAEEKGESDASPASDNQWSPNRKEGEPETTRFRDNGDGTVSDPDTGLVWTKDANLPGDTLLLHQALDYIAEMNSGNVPNFGYTDWRLPTVDELRSLIDYTRYTGKWYRLPQGHPFEHVKPLTKGTYATPTYLWKSEFPRFVSLYCRVVGHNTDACFGYLWPVRGGTSIRSTPYRGVTTPQ